MTEREIEGLNGPVQKIIVSTPWSTLREIILLFDPAGRLSKREEFYVDDLGRIRATVASDLKGLRRRTRTFRTGDWVESETLPVRANLFWSGLRELHGLGFATHQAERVEIYFECSGVPKRFDFLGHNNDIHSAVDLVSDTHGNVLSAKTSPISAYDPQVEFLFEYDEQGRLAARKHLMNQIECEECKFTYNNKGDCVMTKDDGFSTYFNYQYDHQNNWISKTTSTDLGSETHTTTRSIVYYDL